MKNIAVIFSFFLLLSCSSGGSDSSSNATLALNDDLLAINISSESSYSISGSCQEIEAEVTVELEDEDGMTASPDTQPSCTEDRTFSTQVNTSGLTDGNIEIVVQHGSDETIRTSILKDTIIELTLDDDLPNFSPSTTEFRLSGDCELGLTAKVVSLEGITSNYVANCDQDGRWETIDLFDILSLNIFPNDGIIGLTIGEITDQAGNQEENRIFSDVFIRDVTQPKVKIVQLNIPNESLNGTCDYDSAHPKNHPDTNKILIEWRESGGQRKNSGDDVSCNPDGTFSYMKSGLFITDLKATIINRVGTRGSRLFDDDD